MSRLVYLQWIDTTVHPDTWVDEEDALKWAEKDIFMVEDVGWVIKETEDYILIASSRTKDDDDVQYGHVSRIPIPWIMRKVTIL